MTAPLLLDEKAAALLLTVSSRTLRRRVARGEAPPPIKIGRLTRWRITDLEAWVASKPAERVPGVDP